MKINKRVLASMATATALAGAGFVVADHIQQVPAVSQTQNVQAAWVNNYIKTNNIKPVGIQKREGTFNQWFGYRNGVGKPEGIVIHDTENPNDTAASEESYFNNNWRTIQSYVHAFVDYKEIRNIHDTNYGVWGAGGVANQRFIQVELCSSSKTQDQFARSVENQAYYAAAQLKQYGLKPSRATASGTGTIWSHHEVTKYLGGTDHTDPDGYFAKWGYSMAEMYDLIVANYNQITGNGNGGGTITPPAEQTPPGNSVAKKTYYVVNPNGATSYTDPKAGMTSNGVSYGKDTSWVVDRVAEYNGVTYYRIANNTWLKGSDISTTKNGAPVTNGGGNDGGVTSIKGVYTVTNSSNATVYNFSTNKNAMISANKAFEKNSKWQTDQTKTVSGTLYYRVSTNEWMKANDGTFAANH